MFKPEPKLPSVYIETTIPSLATSRPSRDMIIAGRQATTLLFWESERHKYDLYVSQYVIDECLLGDADAAERRMSFNKLSWNCAHLGIHTYVKIRQYNDEQKLHTPVLLTPEALMESIEE
jgi:hypothetical protein